MSTTQSSAAAARIVRFSAEAFPERTRLAMWQEAMRRNIVGLDNEPLVKDQCPILNAVGIALPSLGIAIATSAPQHVRRTRELLPDGNDNLCLIILRGSPTAAIVTQFGREITIDPGGAVMLSHSDRYCITFPSAVRLRVLNLRREILRPLLHDFDAIIARPIPRQTEGLRLLSKYVEGLTEEPALNAADFARLVVSQIYDLVALTMGATREAAEIAKGRGIRAARLREIKADIAEKLASSNLSVETVAMRQQVSPRYVQMLFEQEGTTFSQYVIGQRLLRAHRMLTDPRFADRSITSLAFDAGFGDSSYFNRAFRRCYGGTPSEVRADAIRRKDA
jgi:AraC-like DNA-binding protein